ncbi:hypothetical protein [Kitasatospora sp. NPDC004272]
MTAACPACSTADRTLLVTAALHDPADALDRPTRRLLDVPREPKNPSRGSVVLFVLAGLQALWIVRSIADVQHASGPDTPYAVIALLVHVALSAVLAVAGGLVRRADLRRRALQGHWPLSYEQWTLVHKVWRAAWLCRNCRVAFFPLGALRPDFPASPPLRYEHFQDWLNETARQTELAGGFAPTDRKPAAPAA